jgi:cellulose synthase/poly-beta-1,6-N-acetylglucosamine synthase-like glycosyltransferase
MISVIIPSYNAEKTITSTIKALLNQNYPKNKYEVIVVDDGSIDKNVKVVSNFSVKLIKLKHKGPANARNVGAKKSRGDIILFTDADCVPDANWIKNMVEPFKDKKIVGVSGTYKTLNSDKMMARFSGYEIEHRHEKMKKQKYIDFIGTFSAGYRKNVFLDFKGFDTRFKTSSGEDPELSYRISKAGLKMVFQKNAIVRHPHPDNLWKYLKQKFYRAFWRNLMYSKHKDKIFSDSYTEKTMFPQILITGLIPFIPLISNYHSLFLILNIPIFIFFIAVVFNLDFMYFILQKEKKMILLSPFILSLRNIFILFGFFFGMVNLFIRK